MLVAFAIGALPSGADEQKRSRWVAAALALWLAATFFASAAKLTVLETRQLQRPRMDVGRRARGSARAGRGRCHGRHEHRHRGHWPPRSRPGAAGTRQPTNPIYCSQLLPSPTAPPVPLGAQASSTRIVE